MEYRTLSRRLGLLAAGLIAGPFICGAAMAATAQQPSADASGSAPASPSRTMPAPKNVSPKTIDKAGKALHRVLAINQSYGAKLSGARNEAEKQKLVADAKDKAMGAINSEGLSVHQYNEVLAAAQRNPAVRAALLGAAGITTKK